jgi:two-component system, cell cycle response regulator DivK
MSVTHIRSALSAARAPARAPHSVLLADPHEDTRSLYACYLTIEGWEVETAEDGREALAKALTRHFDAIVTETRLPGIDGYELCHLLRRDPATLHTPVLFVTADARTAEQRAKWAGADGVLVKPCLPESILTELVRVTRAERDVAGASPLASPPNGSEPRAGESSSKRFILSREHRRASTTTPPDAPPSLHCPTCDKILVYDHSYVGGVSMRHPEQWDYFECPGQCGQFEYRHRTRKVRHVTDASHK